MIHKQLQISTSTFALPYEGPSQQLQEYIMGEFEDPFG